MLVAFSRREEWQSEPGGARRLNADWVERGQPLESERRPMTSEGTSQPQKIEEVELGSIVRDQEEKTGEDQGGMVSSGLNRHNLLNLTLPAIFPCLLVNRSFMI